MDLSFLPKIFTLAVVIVAFQPLVRRAGKHTNVWFLGWSFMLLHAILQALPDFEGTTRVVVDLLDIWTADFCALSFLVATANGSTRRLSRWRLAEFALPVLFQSTLSVAGPSWRWLHYLSCALFFAPVVHVALQRSRRSRPLVVVSMAFAAFATLLFPLVASRPVTVAEGSLTLMFLSSAYLYTISAAKFTRGVLLAVAGLVGWALRYPLVALVARSNPGLHLEDSLLDLPQYLIAAGIILTLIEEHMSRTERMAMHDPLTDLPNRRLFEERLIATMEDARVHHTTVACLVIDVDNFKAINDTLGHTAGDQLLRALAIRLSWHMSPRDLLARTGGDEFTALLAGVTDEHHLRFIAGAMMSAASVPIMIDGSSVDVRISVGIALSPDDADDIDSLRRAADEAMYTAKRKGGSLLAFAGDL